MPALPVDIWLLVFDVVDDIDTLWSVVRNVSHYIRDCVDEYFRRGVLHNTLIDLHYSNINRHGGPTFQFVHLPLQFSSVSQDGVRANFRLMHYVTPPKYAKGGTIRGWIPFIEKYFAETRKPTPRILNKSKSADGLPAWEQQHIYWRNRLAGIEKTTYLDALRDHSTIGRGDRPPFLLRIGPYISDTELIGLEVNCETHEISIDWRKTFSACFMELHFIILAQNDETRLRIYDQALVRVAARIGQEGYRRDKLTIAQQVRRKRLQPWVAKNKRRMTQEHRLQTEDKAERRMKAVKHYLHKSNLRDVDKSVVADEIVPERCADDHPDLLMWPWGGEDVFWTSKKRFTNAQKQCIVM